MRKVFTQMQLSCDVRWVWCWKFVGDAIQCTVIQCRNLCNWTCKLTKILQSVLCTWGLLFRAKHNTLVSGINYRSFPTVTKFIPSDSNCSVFAPRGNLRFSCLMVTSFPARTYEVWQNCFQSYLVMGTPTGQLKGGTHRSGFTEIGNKQWQGILANATSTIYCL